MEILPGDVWWMILEFVQMNDLITLLYVLKHLRELVLIKFNKYFKLSSGFCFFHLWKKKLCDNTFELLDDLETHLEMSFDFELYVFRLMKTMRHLSLFSVCLQFLRCFRSCDKMPKSKLCFYCSCVTMKNYQTPSVFMDIVIDEHHFEEQFCLTDPSCIDLDITEERLNYPKLPLDDKQCDYYE